LKNKLYKIIQNCPNSIIDNTIDLINLVKIYLNIILKDKFKYSLFLQKVNL